MKAPFVYASGRTRPATIGARLKRSFPGQRSPGSEPELGPTTEEDSP